jgi:hypothetical protein
MWCIARIMSASALIIILGSLSGVLESLTACLLSHHCSTIVGVILRRSRWWRAWKIHSSSIRWDVYKLIIVIRNVAERCFVSPVDIIHAAAATCLCRWSDLTLPIISFLVVGSESVLLIRSPGGGRVFSMSSAKLVGLCVHMSCPICWYVMG